MEKMGEKYKPCLRSPVALSGHYILHTEMSVIKPLNKGKEKLPGSKVVSVH